MKILRLTCCLFVLLLSLVAFTFSPSAQASGPQSGGGGGGGNCMVAGVTVCSITVVSGRIILAGTTVLISTSVTCTTPSGFTFLSPGSGNVGITQVSHHQIVEANSSFLLTTCDGTTQTIQVPVSPSAGSPPFHGGHANAFGSLFQICFMMNTFHNQQQCTGINTAQVVIQITG